MAGEDYKFEGWMGLDAKSADGNMVWQEFPGNRKPFEETDVDIQITHSGICGSDLHTLRSGWGATPYPVCVGHEIVGKAVRVGSKVEKGIKVGDRVGVGAQNASCLKPDCEWCSAGDENYCTHTTNTFADTYADGSMSYGGYANYHRAPSHFVMKIPEGIPSEAAAPMLCGGITLYSPLKNHGCGPGKKVGIIGVGGLGHFGVIFAKALGADKVVGISRKADKKDDVLKMGADEYIATSDDKDWAKHNARSLDLIICTVSSPQMPLNDYLGLLRPKGTFVQVGAPEDKLPDLTAFAFIARGVSLAGSMIGPPWQIEEMLKFAAEKKLQPWIEKIPMEKANEAIVRMDQGKATDGTSTQKIWLVSNDAAQIEVDRTVAERSMLIKNMLEDIGDETVTKETPIPIPNVNEAVLRKVIEWCEHHRNDPPQAQDDESDARKKTTDIEEWDQKFMQVDQEMLFEIILASNYLDIKPLLDVGCKTVANMIKGKSPEEIRKTFNITNDFTPEEEEQIRRENEWAEDR